MTPIRTAEDYEAAVRRVEALWDAAPSSAEEDELEVLGILIERYEERHFPIGLPDPIEAIKACMEDGGLTRKDLVPYIGPENRIAEVLGRRRRLSLTMIRKLHAGLRLPLEVLVQDYPLTDRRAA